MQESSERQKWKTILGPLLSEQVIANCKEKTHTSLQIIQHLASTYSVAQTVGPSIRHSRDTFTISYLDVCFHYINLLL